MSDCQLAREQPAAKHPRVIGAGGNSQINVMSARLHVRIVIRHYAAQTRSMRFESPNAETPFKLVSADFAELAL